MFTTEVQFGHAGSMANSDMETADAKNAAMRAAGFIVPDTFEDLPEVIKQAYERLVSVGTIKPAPEREPPKRQEPHGSEPSVKTSEVGEAPPGQPVQHRAEPRGGGSGESESKSGSPVPLCENSPDAAAAPTLGDPPPPPPPVAPTERALPAVVPKFFGYYAVAGDDDARAPRHPGCDVLDRCGVSWPSRILLLEECGEPVTRRKFLRKHR